ncbi:hypothetical protein [Chryseobacterium arthrosphaerae]|uniref:hypothetical protein n=1 Tax=Chryseobacterium arthrosphaerae TaxID=651561 RepID=UPI001E5CB3D6|nr:hypothetical protein [Chryseobacterium arthrosphaerae]UEQ75221.1 hypothetical protein J8N07_16360 [Chryseobacterium arthrosphaerae]
MLTENEILKIAKKYVSESEKDFKTQMVLLEDYIVKKSYGHIFFYTTKAKFENPESEIDIVGNAPFIVERKSGKIVEFGTARSSTYYIEEYEAGRWPLKNF